MRRICANLISVQWLQLGTIAMVVPALLLAQAPGNPGTPGTPAAPPGTTLIAKSDSKGTTVCNVTKKTNGDNGDAQIVVTDANGTQTMKLKTGFCALFPLSGAAIALTAAASASTIAGMTAATVIATTAVVGGVSIAVVTGAAIGAATAGTLGALAATGAFSSGKSTSPCGQNQQGNNNCQGQNQQ